MTSIIPSLPAAGDYIGHLHNVDKIGLHDYQQDNELHPRSRPRKAPQPNRPPEPSSFRPLLQEPGQLASSNRFLYKIIEVILPEPLHTHCSRNHRNERNGTDDWIGGERLLGADDTGCVQARLYGQRLLMEG